MEHEAKVWKLARILVGKHGRDAPRIAHDRAQDSLTHHDYDGATLWSQTAKVTQNMTADGARRRPANPEPALEELLEDPVTQTVMQGDGVEREELEQVLEKAKRKLDGD